MLEIKQLKRGKVIYQAKIKEYDYSIPQFIKNGATEIKIKGNYPITYSKGVNDE